MVELNTIYNEDCIKTIGRMDNNLLDLVVTSPPYNVDLGNNKYHKNPYDIYIDNKDHHEYINWLANIFKALYPKIKSGGRLCVNIGDGKNGAVPTSSDLLQKCVDIGYIPMSHIIWNKFQVGPRTAWGSWKSPSSPSFPTPFEHMLVFCKDTNKLQWKGETDLLREEFIDWSLAMWKFAPETKQKQYGHNAMFPVELPVRCIKMFSWIGSVVYDPFMGAGTTAVACKLHNRNFIGSEISAAYCKTARERIRNGKEI